MGMIDIGDQSQKHCEVECVVFPILAEKQIWHEIDAVCIPEKVVNFD